MKKTKKVIMLLLVLVVLLGSVTACAKTSLEETTIEETTIEETTQRASTLDEREDFTQEVYDGLMIIQDCFDRIETRVDLVTDTMLELIDSSGTLLADRLGREIVLEDVWIDFTKDLRREERYLIADLGKIKEDMPKEGEKLYYLWEEQVGLFGRMIDQLEDPYFFRIDGEGIDGFSDLLVIYTENLSKMLPEVELLRSYD